MPKAPESKKIKLEIEVFFSGAEIEAKVVKAAIVENPTSPQSTDQNRSVVLDAEVEPETPKSPLDIFSDTYFSQKADSPPNFRGIGKNPKKDEEWLKSLISAFGDVVDIRQEIQKANVWCLANPTKAPKANMRRFLTNWISRSYETMRKNAAPNNFNDMTGRILAALPKVFDLFDKTPNTKQRLQLLKGVVPAGLTSFFQWSIKRGKIQQWRQMAESEVRRDIANVWLEYQREILR